MRSGRTKDPAAITMNDACGTPSRSATIGAPKSVSSHTTTSGSHCRQMGSRSAARSRAILRPNPSRRSRSSRCMSTLIRGRVTGSSPASLPEGKHANPNASTAGTIHGRAANATSWPAALAARASGRSGCRWPLPPANVHRIRMGSLGLA